MLSNLPCRQPSGAAQDALWTDWRDDAGDLAGVASAIPTPRGRKRRSASEPSTKTRPRGRPTGKRASASTPRNSSEEGKVQVQPLPTHTHTRDAPYVRAPPSLVPETIQNGNEIRYTQYTPPPRPRPTLHPYYYEHSANQYWGRTARTADAPPFSSFHHSAYSPPVLPFRG